MAYHVWFGRVSGGVDVFLLLSAFFLTGAFIRKVESARPLALLTYWLNVFRRLLPAAVLVLLAVIAASVALLPKVRWASIMEQTAASLFYAQNWQLAGDSVDYYATDHATASPLQHFWSLSIQGQVFILWPLAAGRRPGALEGTCRPLAVAGLPRHHGRWSSGQCSLPRWPTPSTSPTPPRNGPTSTPPPGSGSLPWGHCWPCTCRCCNGCPPCSPCRWAGWAWPRIVACGMLLQVEHQFPGYLALWPTLAAAFVIMAPQSRLRGATGARRSRHW